MSIVTEAAPFRIDYRPKSTLKRAALGASRSIVENLLGLHKLNDVYAAIRAHRGGSSFEEAALAVLGVTWKVPDADFQNIPSAGPCVVVANHPFGGIEGLMLVAMLQRVRPDVKILTNLLLRRIPELRETQIFVDVFGGANATAHNVTAMRTALAWARDGHCLAIFPAGEVSHLRMRERTVTDPPWNGTITRLIGRARCPVVPVYFHGRNSRMFHAAGLVHPRLRTALLPNEVLKRQHSEIIARIGRSIPFDRIDKIPTIDERTAYIRLRTYLLKSGIGMPGDKALPAPFVPTTPVANAGPIENLVADVDRLGASRRLVTSGPFDVYCAKPREIPNVLREIGRERERTFRAVGEGSGHALDLDRFDDYYRHLFVWDREQRRLVGAYRMGLADRILAARGVAGLYTNTLFRFNERLLREIGPALELGRSFIVKEYQKTYSPLLLLWKGIAQYIVTHPRYRSVFGAVSISNDYHCMTKQLLMAFLKAHEPDAELRRLARPKNPPRRIRALDLDPGLIAMAAPDLRSVDELVSEIESDRKPMPVLLRQYLKLHGRLLGFNVDPDFGNVLDGLILVQLDRLDARTLDKYMGPVGARQFLAHRSALPA